MSTICADLNVLRWLLVFMDTQIASQDDGKVCMTRQKPVGEG